ncbi:MAG: VOC family protein [Clostridia bacterium]|nr:VOC family protein [Clostridia bacterium]
MNTKIPGMAIAHIALKASDFEKSLKFYTDLGMEPYLSWGEGEKRVQMLKFGGGAGILELFAGGEKPDGEYGEYAGKYIHFAYAVEDVEAAYNTALAAGARSKVAPKIATPGTKPEAISLNVAFVYGPDGEELEFFKEIR